MAVVAHRLGPSLIRAFHPAGDLAATRLFLNSIPGVNISESLHGQEKYELSESRRKMFDLLLIRSTCCRTVRQNQRCRTNPEQRLTNALSERRIWNERTSNSAVFPKVQKLSLKRTGKLQIQIPERTSRPRSAFPKSTTSRRCKVAENRN